MTIAELGVALRGLPRDAEILIETPAGPKPLRLINPTRIAVRDGQIEQHATYEQYAIVLHARE